MKAIIKRKLSLDVNYTIINKKYIPLENGCAIGCDNCGKLIANIATVKDEKSNVFNIGFDCLETLLMNNHLLNYKDIEEYQKIKKLIPKVLRFAKQLKETINLNNGLDGFKFERPSDLYFPSDWITYYLLKGNAKPYNTNVKLKEMDFDFLINTLKNIFPKHSFIVN